MTTTYPTSDLATRALRDLGLIGAEETPSGADLVWATETANTVNDQLTAEGISIWNAAVNIIPSEYFLPMSRRVGVDMATSFGLMSFADGEAMKPVLNAVLRRVSAPQPTGATLQTEYF